MSSWGKSRRNFIVLIVVALILVPVFVILLNIYIEPANCFDKKQNGDENGIDCGGSCSIMCNHQVIEPIIHWTRFFEVGPGIYNVVAYIENQNVNAISRNVEYKFDLIDKNNIILDSRSGLVDIKPREIIPIIESNLYTGKLKPQRTSFKFADDIVWHNGEAQERVIRIQDEKEFEVDGLPRISAKVINSSFRAVNNISAIAIVYDDKDNAIAISSTFLEALNKDESRIINFTWPQQFPAPFSRFEIIPLYETNS